uniref:LRAT domain-containing protein n=1 Tax=Fundulus heteroclitus TaxID=8078 RepID=A0A3Q2PMZ2_FUNHE
LKVTICFNKKQPKPGDLIEIFRSGYQHWAVYIGGGYVVHFVLNGDSSSSTVPVQGGMGVVLKEKLEEVVGNNRWKINNYLDGKNKPQKVYAIVKQAVGFIGNQLHYNLATYNCKHFATELRYGKPVSQQVGCRPGVTNLFGTESYFVGVVTYEGLPVLTFELEESEFTLTLCKIKIFSMVYYRCCHF